jgi:hypothetical protein
MPLATHPARAWALAALLPALSLAAQETPHPNRLSWLSIFTEPLPEGRTAFDLEGSNQFLRVERQDSSDGLTHAELQGEDWEIISDLARPAGPGILNLRIRVVDRSEGFCSQAIKNWHNLLGVGDGGRYELPTFQERYILVHDGVPIFDLTRPKVELQGLDLAYVRPWGDGANGERLGGSVQLPTGDVQQLQSSGGVNYLAGGAIWRTAGHFRFWAQLEDTWITLPRNSTLRPILSQGAFARAWVGVAYQGPGGSTLKGFGVDLSLSINESPYDVRISRIDKYGLQQTWVIRHLHCPRWRFGFTEKAGTFSTPEITGFVAFRP